LIGIVEHGGKIGPELIEDEEVRTALRPPLVSDTCQMERFSDVAEPQKERR
jgi:hypothetical protein